MPLRWFLSNLSNIGLKIAYDGTDFHGFSRQQNLRTVQGAFEDVLERILGYPVEVFASGRTDAGVHARAQVIHWSQAEGPPAERFVYLLRRSLPPDIVPLLAVNVPDSFHSRFSVVQKTYLYRFQLARTEDVFTKRYAWHIPLPLRVEMMEMAAKLLIGVHDFTSFCAAATPIKDKCRTLFDVRLESNGSYLELRCVGNGFLRNMVRIIAGTLVEVGLGRMTAAHVLEVLQARDRRSAGRTAPAHGLTLWEVKYPNDELV